MNRIIYFLVTLFITWTSSVIEARPVPSPNYFPVVEMSDNGQTLTFFKSRNPPIAGGDLYGIGDNYTGAPDWCTEVVKKIVIDPSFSYFKPNSMAYWFSGCSNLETIEGLENLKTDNVTNMDNMFSGCRSLTTIDLCGFSTQNLTSCHNMFASCSNLQTIYGNNWDITANMSETNKINFLIFVQHLSTSYMFHGCNSLVGGNGTKYNPNINDYTYCHIDGGTRNPGYFTDKLGSGGHEDGDPYCVLESGILTFYYDKRRNNRTGHTYNVNELYNSDFHRKVGSDEGLPGWHDDREEITKVVFDTSFYNYTPTSTANWFFECSNLLSLEGVENLNTAEIIDMGSMFRKCHSLKDINLTHFLTTKVQFMDGLFYGCESLTGINLNSFNTSKVKSMLDMFGNCYSLTQLDLGNFSTAEVNAMAGMFYHCTNLKVLNIKSFDTSSVTDMAYMFAGCESITSLNLNHFSTSNVTDMKGMFNGCSQLRNLDIRNFDTRNVKDMSYMFAVTPNLNSLDISKFNTANVTNMRAMFSGCATQTLDVRSFNTAKVTDMSSMFNCKNIAVLDVSGFSTSNVVTMDWMFYLCSNLEMLDLGSFNTAQVNSMSGMFSGCERLKEINLSSFDTNNVNEMAYMFYNCGSLQIIDLTNFNTKNVTSMNKMFEGCSTLQTIFASRQWTIGSIGDNSDMFTDCTNLIGGLGTFFTPAHSLYDYAHIDGGSEDPGYLTDKNAEKAYAVLYNGTLTFYYDDKAWTHKGKIYPISQAYGISSEGGSAIVNRSPYWLPDSLSVIHAVFDVSFAQFHTNTTFSWFKGQANLKDIQGMNNLNTSRARLMTSMFKGAASLKELDLSYFTFLNLYKYSMDDMFMGCSQLKTIYVSEAWNNNYIIDSNSAGMFLGCLNLVGEKGTRYNSSYTDNSYARVDGGGSSPGYLTLKTSTSIHNAREKKLYNVYDMNGHIIRHNAKSTAGLCKGLYIIEGRKVIID